MTNVAVVHVVVIVPWEDYAVLEDGPYIFCISPPEILKSRLTIDEICKESHEVMEDILHQVCGINSLYDNVQHSSEHALETSLVVDAMEIGSNANLRHSSRNLDTEHNTAGNMEETSTVSLLNSEHNSIFFLLTSDLKSGIAADKAEVDMVAASYKLEGDDTESSVNTGQDSDVHVPYIALGSEGHNSKLVSSFHSFETDSLECVNSHQQTPSVWSEDNSLNVRIESLSDEVFEVDTTTRGEQLHQLSQSISSSEQSITQEPVLLNESIKPVESYSFDSSKSQGTSYSAESGSFYLDHLFEHGPGQPCNPDHSVNQTKFNESYSLDSDRSQSMCDFSENDSLGLTNLFYSSSESEIDRFEVFILSQDSEHFQLNRSSRDDSFEGVDRFCLDEHDRCDGNSERNALNGANSVESLTARQGKIEAMPETELLKIKDDEVDYRIEACVKQNAGMIKDDDIDLQSTDNYTKLYIQDNRTEGYPSVSGLNIEHLHSNTLEKHDTISDGDTAQESNQFESFRIRMNAEKETTEVTSECSNYEKDAVENDILDTNESDVVSTDGDIVAEKDILTKELVTVSLDNEKDSDMYNTTDKIDLLSKREYLNTEDFNMKELSESNAETIKVESKFEYNLTSETIKTNVTSYETIHDRNTDCERKSMETSKQACHDHCPQENKNNRQEQMNMTYEAKVMDNEIINEYPEISMDKKSQCNLQFKMIKPNDEANINHTTNDIHVDSKDDEENQCLDILNSYFCKKQNISKACFESSYYGQNDHITAKHSKTEAYSNEDLEQNEVMKIEFESVADKDLNTKHHHTYHSLRKNKVIESDEHFSEVEISELGDYVESFVSKIIYAALSQISREIVTEEQSHATENNEIEGTSINEIINNANSCSFKNEGKAFIARMRPLSDIIEETEYISIEQDFDFFMNECMIINLENRPCTSFSEEGDEETVEFKSIEITNGSDNEDSKANSIAYDALAKVIGAVAKVSPGECIAQSNGEGMNIINEVAVPNNEPSNSKDFDIHAIETEVKVDKSNDKCKINTESKRNNTDEISRNFASMLGVDKEYKVSAQEHTEKLVAFQPNDYKKAIYDMACKDNENTMVVVAEVHIAKGDALHTSHEEFGCDTLEEDDVAVDYLNRNKIKFQTDNATIVINSSNGQRKIDKVTHLEENVIDSVTILENETSTVYEARKGLLDLNRYERNTVSKDGFEEGNVENIITIKPKIDHTLDEFICQQSFVKREADSVTTHGQMQQATVGKEITNLQFYSTDSAETANYQTQFDIHVDDDHAKKGSKNKNNDHSEINEETIRAVSSEIVETSIIRSEDDDRNYNIEKRNEKKRRHSRPSLKIEGFLRTQSEEVLIQGGDSAHVDKLRNKYSNKVSQSVDIAFQNEGNLETLKTKPILEPAERMPTEPFQTTTTTNGSPKLSCAESLSKRFKSNISADLSRRNEYNKTARLHAALLGTNKNDEPFMASKTNIQQKSYDKSDTRDYKDFNCIKNSEITNVKMGPRHFRDNDKIEGRSVFNKQEPEKYFKRMNAIDSQSCNEDYTCRSYTVADQISNDQYQYKQKPCLMSSNEVGGAIIYYDQHDTAADTSPGYSQTDNYSVKQRNPTQLCNERKYEMKLKANDEILSNDSVMVDQDRCKKQARRLPTSRQNQSMPPQFLTRGHCSKSQSDNDHRFSRHVSSRYSDKSLRKSRNKSSGCEKHRSLPKTNTVDDKYFESDSRQFLVSQTFDEFSCKNYCYQNSIHNFKPYEQIETENQCSQQYLSSNKKKSLNNFSNSKSESSKGDRSVGHSRHGRKLNGEDAKNSSVSCSNIYDNKICKTTNKTTEDWHSYSEWICSQGNMDKYAEVINKSQHGRNGDKFSSGNIGSDRNQVSGNQYLNDRYPQKHDESTWDRWNKSSVTTAATSINQGNGSSQYSHNDDVRCNKGNTYYQWESEQNLGRYKTSNRRMKIPGHYDKTQKDGPLSLQDTYGSMDNNDNNTLGPALSQSTNHLSGSMTSLNQRQAPASSPSRQGTLQKQQSLQSNQSEINGGGSRDEVEGIKFERLKNLTEDDLMVKIKEIIGHFEKMEDFHRGDGMRIQKMIGDMYWDYNHLREMIGDCMAANGYAVVSMNMLRTLNSIGIFKNDDVWFPTYYTYNTMWNFTDASSNLAKALSDNDAVRLLTMNCGHKPYINAIHSKNVYYVIKASLSILHNIARNSGMKHLFDENKTSEVIMPFLDSEDEMLKILATLTIANIVDEEENKTLIAETGTIHCIVNWIEKALSLPRRRYKGFTPQELTEGLNKLAVNDNNKMRIIEEGALPLFLKMLQNDDVREQSSAARVIWTLSFDKDVRQKITESEELVALLEKLTQSTNKSLQMNTNGALWVIRGDNDVTKESREAKEQEKKKRPKSARSKAHVFLSYAWSDKETVLKIRDKLRAEDYAIWIDVEKMGGSTLEAMATAVENSAVVLVCMSEKYKQSPNCRTEAEYTFQLRKDYIPLMMQKKYRPDGWLGAILGAKLYFDFSGKYPFEKSFQGLLKELRGRGRVTPHETPVDNNDHTDSAIVHSNSSSHSHASLGTPVHLMPSINNSAILNMGQEELIKWLRHIKLTDLIPAFMEFDGKLLMQLKLMRTEAPEFFYQCLEKRLNMSLIEILKFTRALEEL